MQVNIPQIGLVNFPDEMSHEDVVSAIRTKLIPQHVASLGVKAPALLQEHPPLAQADMIQGGEPKMPFSDKVDSHGYLQPTLGQRPQATLPNNTLFAAATAVGNTLGDVIKAPFAASMMTSADAAVRQQPPIGSDKMEGLRQGAQQGLGMLLAPENAVFGLGLRTIHEALPAARWLKNTLMGTVGATMGAEPLARVLPGVKVSDIVEDVPADKDRYLINPPGTTTAEKIADVPGASLGLIAPALLGGKFVLEGVGDLVQTGYKGHGIPNRFATTLMGKNQWTGLGPAPKGFVAYGGVSPNAGSIFPTGSRSVPSVASAIPPDFKEKLSIIPVGALTARYNAAIEASRAFIVAGKNQEASNMGAMAQFMREELQNRQRSSVQNLVKPQQLVIPNENSIEGNIQRNPDLASEGLEEVGKQKANGPSQQIPAVKGQVQETPEVQIPGDVGLRGGTASGSDVLGVRGESGQVNRVGIVAKVKSGLRLTPEEMQYLYQMPVEAQKPLMQEINRNAVGLLPENVPNRLSIQNAQRAWDARQVKVEPPPSVAPTDETVEQRNARMLAESQAVNKAVTTKKLMANAPLVSSETSMLQELQRKNLVILGNSLGLKLPRGAKWTKLQDYEASDLLEQLDKVPDSSPLTVATKKVLAERLQKVQAGDAFSKLGRAAEDNINKRTPASRKSEAGFFRLFGGADLSSLGLKPDTKVQGEQMYNLIKNKLGESSSAFDYMDKAGLKAFLATPKTVQQVQDWLSSVAPKVEVHTYGMEGKVSEAKKEYDRMTHEWYEQLPVDKRSYVDTMKAYGHQYGGHEYSVKEHREGYPDETAPTKELREQAEKYAKLKKQVDAEPEDNNPRATSAYSHVSAFDTTQPMPEWTTSKSGKNVQRVDVVVPQRLKKTADELTAENKRYDEALARLPDEESRREIGRIRPQKEIEPMWTQDNLHENLPNTLGWAMIQYKTGPKGEKIAVIPELQARWAQEKRKYWDTYEKAKKRILDGLLQRQRDGGIPESDPTRMEKYGDKQAHEEAARAVPQYRPGMDHALADNPYRLILKAAIEQARKEGATHIMVSDAETAMMTEGHDAQIYKEMPSEKAANEYAKANPEVSGEIAQIDGKHYVVALHGAEAKAYEQGFKPHQEGGMRLNYDTILPKIAEELTGSKGERLEMGVHKNANDLEHGGLYPTKEEALTVSKTVVPEGKNWRAVVPRKDLIFKEQTGEPKISVTGRVYDISKVEPEKFTTFGKDKPVEAKPSPVQAVDKTRKGEQGSVFPESEAIQRLKALEAKWRLEGNKTLPPGTPITSKELAQRKINELETSRGYALRKGEKADVAFIEQQQKALNQRWGVKPQENVIYHLRSGFSTDDVMEVLNLVKQAGGNVAKYIKEHPELEEQMQKLGMLGGGNEQRYGIAARVSKERADKGQIKEPKVGMVDDPETLVEHGRTLLKNGADPVAALREALKTEKTSTDTFVLLRAHGEQLFKKANAAADEFGINSPEYKKAAKADSDWIKKIKPLQTMWGEQGRAMHGETEVDTGTFHGVARAFEESTGREMNKTESDYVEAKVNEGKALDTKLKITVEDIFKALAEQDPATEAQKAKTNLMHAGPSIGHDLRSPETKGAETLKLWKHVNDNYLKKGVLDFDDVVSGAAKDLGMTPDEVRRQLTLNPKVKKMTDEMYKDMDALRKVKQGIEFWIKEMAMPAWARYVKAVPRIFFLDKIFGHGTVGMVTHAGINAFDPTAWNTYFPSFLRQYKIAFSTVKHEQWVQDQLRKSNFVMWKRAGLKADPYKYADDYQNASIKQFMGRANLLIGNYGFDALKDFRINRANQIWEKTPANLKYDAEGNVNLDYARMVADSVNHATGVMETKMPKFMAEMSQNIMFAPTLEFSRWAWMIGDPLKAMTYIDKWRSGTATPSEIQFAKRELATKAGIVATYASLLALNQGYLSATGSEQKINYNNPKQGDFLAFKVAGKTVGVTSAMLGMVRLFAKMYNAATGPQPAMGSRSDTMAEAAKNYARGKLSPIAGFGADVATQQTAMREVVPWSSDKPKYGEKKLTGGEYAALTFTPIPVSEGIKAVWEEQGMSKEQQNVWLDILKGAAVAVPAGLTGARIAPDYSLEPKPTKPAFKPPGVPKLGHIKRY